MPRKITYAKCTEIMLILGVGLVMFTGRAPAQGSPNSITLENRSGGGAVFKLIGSVRLVPPVPNLSSQTVHVPAGSFYIIAHCCEASGACTYSQGDSVYVTQTATAYSMISVSLPMVPNGNYHTTPTSEAAFNGNWGGQTPPGALMRGARQVRPVVLVNLGGWIGG